MKLVMDDAAVEAIVSMLMRLQNEDNVDLRLYEKQLEETNRAIGNMLNAIQQGIFTRSTKERLDELEAAKDELEAKIANERLEKPKISREFMTFWLHRFRELDVTRKEHRKLPIEPFVNSIFLYDDKMVIAYNFKEGTRMVVFDEMKDSAGSDMDCSGEPIKSQPRGWFFMLSGSPRHRALQRFCLTEKGCALQGRTSLFGRIKRIIKG